MSEFVTENFSKEEQAEIVEFLAGQDLSTAKVVGTQGDGDVLDLELMHFNQYGETPEMIAADILCTIELNPPASLAIVLPSGATFQVV